MSGFPKAGDEYGGRYRIVRQLGHGGMGVVYEAVDKVLNRSVALKIVLPSLPDREDFTARFAREASVLARIRSRNIVQIHEYGEDGETVYFVTELFPDGDLQSWLATRGPLDRRAALSLIAQVGEALADAHAMGVIHRDVKPGNVLLWSRPEGLIPYLADFGIAIDTPESGSTRASLTRTGTLVGSPAYMAPERHFGHPADERGDVYSLGCLLWSVLTGEAPYTGTDFQMMNAHINGAIPALATGHPVDDRIDAVLAGALNKDPERRTASPAEMRADLLAIVKDIDAAVVPPPLAPPAAPPAGRAAGPTTPPPSGPPVDLASPGAAGAAAAAGAALDDGHTRAVSVRPPAGSTTGPSAGASAGAGDTSTSNVLRTPSGPTPPGGRASRPGSSGTTGPRGKRWWAVALGAAGVVLAVGVGVAVVAATGGDDEPASSGPAAGSSESPAANIDAPEAPTVKARPGYRSVVFSVTPASTSGEQRIEADLDGQGWEEADDPLRVPTEQGGARGCVQVRTVAVSDTGDEAASEPVKACGKAKPRTVRLVRTNDECAAAPGCRWYNVYITGFASGSDQQAVIYDSTGSPWCDCTFNKIRVKDDGRGAQIHEWQVAPGSIDGYVTLVVDGIGQRVFVP
ncbi:serine/threonine protein kinase [Nocardioides sp. KIGAM211]|uniref:non-specific serine/threonine protein kinase n=1 Tax=Nocardioides luti TaxID=2761101 RepID=A0A7X0RI96_9ACTN|nr:serine/threonine-protein kinase [Nocardioides luti]MBB6628831.1 serine/threonine protein kinase [Nocardioides luti]